MLLDLEVLLHVDILYRTQADGLFQELYDKYFGLVEEETSTTGKFDFYDLGGKYCNFFM